MYTFYLAFQSEEELEQLKQEENPDPTKLELKILPNGQPSYKTLYASADTEEEATARVDAYVSQTPYRDIEDRKIL